MVYTIQFDLDIDDEDILESEELEGIVSDCMSSAAVTVRDFKVVSIND